MLSLAYVVFAIFFDFTPLRYPLQSFNRWALTAFAVIWLINIIVVRRSITRVMNRFWGGIVTAFVIIGLVGFIAVLLRIGSGERRRPAVADGAQSRADVAQRDDRARSAEAAVSVLVEPDAAIVAGAKIYMQNCADCHGSGTGDMSNMAAGMYLEPPQFAKHGVDDDPAGRTYWKIEHGIRWTAMPAYATRSPKSRSGRSPIS